MSIAIIICCINGSSLLPSITLFANKFTGFKEESINSGAIPRFTFSRFRLLNFLLHVVTARVSNWNFQLSLSLYFYLKLKICKDILRWYFLSPDNNISHNIFSFSLFLASHSVAFLSMLCMSLPYSSF